VLISEETKEILAGIIRSESLLNLHLLNLHTEDMVLCKKCGKKATSVIETSTGEIIDVCGACLFD